MATHTIMPKKLAQALMDAGMTHMDLGGLFGASNSYHQDDPNITNQDNLPGQISMLQGQSGDIYNQQQSLASQLLAQSQGQGPNIAQNQLNQSTGANVANQAALMAGQRGAGANAGLMARQAAMQGANIQQQSAGQGATLGAQQQIAAQNSLGSLQNNIANQNLQNQSIQQGALAAQNATSTTGQLGAGNINAGRSAGNASTNGGIAGGLIGGGASMLGSLMYKGGPVKKYAAGGPVNDNLGIANFATAGGQSMGTGTGASGSSGDSMGKGLQAAGKVGGKYLKNGNWEQTDQQALDGYANADSVLGTTNPTDVTASSSNLGGSDFAGGISDMDPFGIGTGAGAGDAGMLEGGGDGLGALLGGGAGDAGFMGGAEGGGLGEFASGLGDFFGGILGLGGGAIEGVGAGAAAPEVGEGIAVVAPAMAEEGAMVAAHGGKIPFSRALLNGGQVPGQAQVKGDSPKNDNQPTLLSPGEIVLPRSVTQSPDMEKKAVEFLRHLSKKKNGGYVAKARR